MSRPHVPGYELADLIASGSSATVWAATPVGGAADLAVKVVPVAPDSADRLSFELSALTATRGNDHLIEVREVVAIDSPEPAVAIVMPRLHHGSLARLVAIRGHLRPGEVITVLTPVALTVAQLHDEAVVHGDLSAANIGFDDLGRPVVLDLGLSSVIGTPREVVYGTPGFIAPEVLAGGASTPASDVYAIGALGWFALVGEPPALPADRQALLEVLPDVPVPMAEAIEKALHPHPGERGDGRELARAVYDAGTARPIQPVSGHDPAHMLTHRVRSAPDEQQQESRRGRREELRSRSRAAHQRVVASLAGALLLGLCGTVVAGQDRGAPMAPASDATPSARAAPTPAPEPTAHAVETPGAVEFDGIVQDLVDARARAWNDADVAALPAVFAADSAQLARDAELITTAVDAGHTYAGLAFAVDDVTVLTESADRVTVRTTVQTSGYTVRTETAQHTDVEDRSAQSARVVLTLVRLGDGWRIAEVSPGEV